MTMNQSERYAVFSQWCDDLVAAGTDPVPWRGDVARIVDQWPTWPQTLNPSTVVWRPTIEWLMRQLDLGVERPHEAIPDALMAPVRHFRQTSLSAGPGRAAASGQAASATPTAVPAPEQAPTGEKAHVPASPDDPMVALSMWRDAVTADLPEGSAALPDGRLRLILKSPHTSAHQLAGMLPKSLRDRGADLAALMAALRSGEPLDLRSGESLEESADVRGPKEGTRSSSPSKPAAGQTTQLAPETAAPHRPPDSRGAAVNSGALALSTGDFDEYDFTSRTEYVPRAITASPAAEGWTIRWPPVVEEDSVVVYRLVSRDDIAPYAPEAADLIVTTSDLRAVDDRPFRTAVRHYQVWRNSGPDLDSALHSQPVLHADGAVVGRVENFELREDSGRVVGRWVAPAGVERVQVHRFPVEQVRFAGPTEESRIWPDEDHRSGVVDTTVTRGQAYVYLVYAQAKVGGVTQLSTAPRRQEVVVSAVLSPVRDLEVTPHGDDTARMFDLQWTNPPAGRVIIYRTQQPPLAGAANQTWAASALAQMQLADNDRLPDPIHALGEERSTMRSVPWPEGWTRAYFTPVTVLDETAHVGTTASATWVPPVEMPRIVERVGRQVLTFAWPNGAASVQVFVGPRGGGPESALKSQPYEISESRYRELGGLTFPVLLPSLGCSIHVVPVAFAAGDRVEGVPVSIEYPGLLRLAYRTELKRSITGRPQGVTLAVTSELDLENPPPFVLVHNAERLPLDVSDGSPLDVIREGDETMATTRRFVPDRLSSTPTSRWIAEVKNLRGGYVRLFVDIPTKHLARVALVDPPVNSLSLQQRAVWKA